VLGTPAYMSPEQGRGAAVDGAADIWAFGCVLFEMLTGISPFGESTPTDVSTAVLHGETPWASLAPGAPPSLRALVKSCLERNPRNRLRHIRDACLLLDAAATEGGSSVTDVARGSTSAGVAPGRDGRPDRAWVADWRGGGARFPRTGPPAAIRPRRLRRSVSSQASFRPVPGRVAGWWSVVCRLRPGPRRCSISSSRTNSRRGRSPALRSPQSVLLTFRSVGRLP
jgi:serine/threonine protein kinase